MTEKQRQHLKKFNNKTPEEIRADDLKRWWDIAKGSPYMRRPTLSHIHHTQRQATVHPSKELMVQIEKLLKLYPQYVPSYSSETIGANLIMAYTFFLLGYLEVPIMPYLVYLTWMDWKMQQKTRSSQKRRRLIYKDFETLGITTLALSEAYKIAEKYKDDITPHYRKGEINFAN